MTYKMPLPNWLTAIDVAKQKEFMENRHGERQGETWHYVFPAHDISISSLAGRTSIEILPDFHGKLNRIVCLGIDCKVE